MLAPALSSLFSRPPGQLSSFYQHTSQRGLGVEVTLPREQAGPDGFKVFDRLLQKGYESLQTSNRYQQTTPETAPGAAQVADRVLGFIERRLQQDVAQGATGEVLADRLEAGLEGFVQGFEQAREQLQDLGLLSDRVSKEIGATYDRVLEGVEGLREKYLNAAGDEPKADAPVGTPAAGAVASGLSAVSEYSYAQRNSFSFEVQTADGDTLRIRANAQELFATRAQFAALGDGNQVAAGRSSASTYSHSQQFDLQIEGELDAGELAAINDLLGKVNHLSDQFFGGDLEAAFNSALNIGYDGSEIVGFALNLSRVEVERATTAYRQFEAPGVYAGPAPLGDLAPLGNFARDLLDALELASPFAQPQQLVRDLADRVGLLDDGRQPADAKRFGPFVERMLDAL